MPFVVRVRRLTGLTILIAAFVSLWLPAAAVQVAHAATDTTPPTCAVTAIVAGPPKQIQISVQDGDGGLQSIVVTAASNVAVSVPPFTTGTLNVVVVTATKIDQSTSFSVTLQLTDLAGNVATCTQGDLPDTTPPTCAVTAIVAGPPKQMQISVQDSDGGLQSIVVTAATNVAVSVPPFTTGTLNVVVVTATKIDQSTSFSVTLQVTDLAGNVATCTQDDIPVGGGSGGGGAGGGPPVNSTPELDSLLLFGAGLSGLGSYALMRLRSRRRQ